MADDLQIKITVDPDLERKLAAGRTISNALPRVMKQAVLYGQSQIPGYPAPPDGSTYRRTGTLGRSLTSMQGQAPGALSRVTPLGNHTIGAIGTNIRYGPYVIGRDRQARVHRGRWYTLQSVIEDAKGGIVKIIRNGIMKYIGD